MLKTKVEEYLVELLEKNGSGDIFLSKERCRQRNNQSNVIIEFDLVKDLSREYKTEISFQNIVESLVQENYKELIQTNKLFDCMYKIINEQIKLNVRFRLNSEYCFRMQEVFISLRPLSLSGIENFAAFKRMQLEKEELEKELKNNSILVKKVSLIL
jgi:hypothetical protein